MNLNIVSYYDLVKTAKNPAAISMLEQALLTTGIVGISDVPEFEQKSRAYIQAARQFAAPKDEIKQKYSPDRDAGETEGYELGVEWFKNSADEWQIDDKKASFYAIVPDSQRNRWPQEIDLKTVYLDLGTLIFNTGKLILKAIGLDERIGIEHSDLHGYGRMLHYYKEDDRTNSNPDWCGAHFDHGIFTGLLPAYYFQNGIEVDEPEEAGLYIVPTNGFEFEKVKADDKSILLFQVGEFGQLAAHDRIHATKHIVKKAKNGIERFTFALFYSAAHETKVISRSQLVSDQRYAANQAEDGSITYAQWDAASLERYRAR